MNGMRTWDRTVREAFVQLADTLVADFDIIDFLSTLADRAVDLLGVSSAGILLADHNGTLSTVAASSEQTRLLELFQLQNSEGPCLDAFHSGKTVACGDMRAAEERWPTFAVAARQAGYESVYGIPMRLREHIVGAVNLFGTEPGELLPESSELAQALVDMAAIGIVHQRTYRQAEQLTEQLQSALDSRVLIEQAKGVLAERHDITVSDAYYLLQHHSRNNNIKLRTVARSVVQDGLDPAQTGTRQELPGRSQWYPRSVRQP